MLSVLHMLKAYITARSAISYRRYITRSIRNGYRARNLFGVLAMIYCRRQYDIRRCRMIYVLRTCDIIAVPIICRRHISPHAVRYHIEDISPVLQGTDIIEKSAPKERFFHGAGDGSRTHTTSLEGWDSTAELHPQTNNILSSKSVFVNNYFS